MAGFAHEVVGTARARLRAYAPIQALVGDKVYSSVPAGADLPYISMADTNARDDDAEGIEAQAIDVTIHVWAGGGDALQDARAIADAVEAALRHYPLPLPVHQLTTMDFRGARVFYDRDGVTAHGVVTFVAYGQKPD